MGFKRVGGCCEPIACLSNDPSLLSRKGEITVVLPESAALVQRDWLILQRGIDGGQCNLSGTASVEVCTRLKILF